MPVTILHKTYSDEYEAADKLGCVPTDVTDFISVIEALDKDYQESVYNVIFRHFARYGVPDYMRPTVTVTKDAPLRRQVSAIIEAFLGSVGDSVIMKGEFDINSLRVYLSCSMFDLKTRKLVDGVMVTRNR